MISEELQPLHVEDVWHFGLLAGWPLPTLLCWASPFLQLLGFDFRSLRPSSPTHFPPVGTCSTSLFIFVFCFPHCPQIKPLVTPTWTCARPWLDSLPDPKGLWS